MSGVCASTLFAISKSAVGQQMARVKGAVVVGTPLRSASSATLFDMSTPMARHLPMKFLSSVPSLLPISSTVAVLSRFRRVQTFSAYSRQCSTQWADWPEK